MGKYIQFHSPLLNAEHVSLVTAIELKTKLYTISSARGFPAQKGPNTVTTSPQYSILRQETFRRSRFKMSGIKECTPSSHDNDDVHVTVYE